MALNYGYPYQPVYPQQLQVQAVSQPQGGFIWVNSEAEADGYLIAPNTAVALWDRAQRVIYIKTADASGLVSKRKLRYTEEGAPAQTGNDNYVTKADFDAIVARLDKLEKEKA